MSLLELYILQELDWDRAEKQQALDEIRAEISDESSLIRARQQLAQIEAEYISRIALRRDAQLIVDQLEQREQATQNRLYSGSVTNPRELGALQEEQVMLRRQITEAEDVLLERMVDAEQTQEVLNRARQTLAALEERRRQRLPQLQLQEQNISAELETLHNSRAEMLSNLPAQMLSTYEALLVSRGGQAVSKVELGRGRDICSACRVALPRSDTQRLRSGDVLVQCNNCRRILYLE